MKNYTCTECGMVLPNVPDDLLPRFCPYCMGKLKADEISNDWMSDIFNDDNLWYVDGFLRLPSIIAHEYWRLRDMFREKQPYGVYFQIRDLAETILKFEVLSVCAWTEERTDHKNGQRGSCHGFTERHAFSI